MFQQKQFENMPNQTKKVSLKQQNFELAQTSCSIQLNESSISSEQKSKKYKKKRIGPYSFQFKDLIGCGYSSKVYKCLKDEDNTTVYAIKVLSMKEMSIANHYLLKNQMDVLRQINHPNLLKLVDIYQTINHSYIITEYCENGTLEKYIKKNQNIDWGNIVYQISQGCQYLLEKSIIHRDLKPANIFLKDCKWKIGDFGFCKKLPNPQALVKEQIKVGSPVFMPLQTLERNMYSAKSDSFALGVIIYLLILKEYPYSGITLNKLIKSYKQKEINWSKLDFLPKDLSSIIKGLCQNNMKERLLISEIDFRLFLNEKSIKEIEQSILLLKNKNSMQVSLCQFINYLMKNSMLFLADNHILYYLMSNHLYHLTTILKWEQNRSLGAIKDTYILPEGKINVTEHLYRKILKTLEVTIKELKMQKNNRCQVGYQKFMDYYLLVKAMSIGDTEMLQKRINGLILHKCFDDLVPNSKILSQLIQSTSQFF